MTDPVDPAAPEYCTITTVYLCGLVRQHTVPYVGPENTQGPYASVYLRHWGQTSYTDRKGTRCDSCITSDVMDHP